jgi:hypothetical protein
MNNLWYLATPYSKYPDGIEAAFIDACKAAGALIKLGWNVYSPIAHTHPIAIHAGIDPLDHAIWLPFDDAMMQAAYGILVVRMPGYDKSFGIAHEIKTFRDAGKPIRYVAWPNIVVGAVQMPGRQKVD